MTALPPHDLLGGPEPTLLPASAHDTAAAALAAGTPAATVAAAAPAASLAWAELAEQALNQATAASDEQSRLGHAIAAYAYARTGYHRGLDALRRAGWKGHGPVPWAHEPNRGYLRSVRALAAAAEHVGETDEVARLHTLLRDGDPNLTP